MPQRKDIPPTGIEKPATRRKKQARRVARGNGGGPRKMPERWRFKEGVRIF